MAVKTFLVENYELALGHAMSATWSGTTIRARGYVACYGGDHRFIAYFLTDNSPVPNPVYVVANKVGAIFLPFRKWNPSLICCATRSRSTPTSTAINRRGTLSERR